MKLVTRLRQSARVWIAKQVALSGVDSNRGWRTLFSSNKDVGWQQDKKLSHDDVLAFSPVYSCITLIASDLGKICLRLMSKDANGVWTETTSAAFSPLLRKPNHYQTRQQFIETWATSKLAHGNTYVLKVRDNRNVVIALYVLDPNRVTPLVAPDGAIYYALQSDDLSKMPFDLPAVPASEIIHDRLEPLFHPLIGVSPLMAAHLPASQGLRIQKNSERFFRNMSRPSGVLTAPGPIDDTTAKRIKDAWEENYAAGNLGRVAVVGDDLKYIPMTVNAVDAQLAEQLKLTGEQVCSAFHVPPYMVNVGPYPSYNNVQALNSQYFSQGLQRLYNAIEDLLDDGLGLAPLGYRTEFDISDLLRMDSTAQAEFLSKMVGAGIMSPNEARRPFNLTPVSGGETPYLQQQYWPLQQLSERSVAPPELPVSSGGSSPPDAGATPQKAVEPEELRAFSEYVEKAFA